jgi:alkylhydroperoxidase family enzyme
MHTKDARAASESEERIFLLDAWREAPFYTEAERVALELTEAVTLISKDGVPAEMYERAVKVFGEQQFVALVMTIITINAWNRINIAAGNVAGRYRLRGHS